MTPTSPREFREYADKCIRWAGTAKTEHERDFFLKIARTWLDAALRVERTLAIIDEDAEKAMAPSRTDGASRYPHRPSSSFGSSARSRRGPFSAGGLDG
jgi:hypothetical protein